MSSISKEYHGSSSVSKFKGYQKVANAYQVYEGILYVSNVYYVYYVKCIMEY